jgi:hypothetical protein
MNDSGTRGSNPTADHELLTTSSRSFSGNKAVYSRIRTLGSYNQDPDYHYATHLLTTDYSPKTGKKLDAVTIWRSDISYTTSSRWFYWFMVEMTDGTNSYSEMLACRDWGNQEGCTNNFQDTHDQTAAGIDGQTWYRHRVAVPSNLDQSKLKIKLRHTERSWDGTSAESSLYYDLLGEETTDGDQTPDSFTFTDQTGVPLATVIVSDPVTISGINIPTEISIFGGEYELNSSGTWTASAGIVNEGNTVRVRQTSSSSNSTNTTTTLTIGGVEGTFTITTAASGDPDATGLVAWWKGNDNAYDSIGGNNGTLQGSASFVPGKEGLAFSLNGSTDFVQVLNPQNIPVGNSSRTISAWVKSSGGTNLYQGIVGYGTPASGQVLFFEWGGNDVDLNRLYTMNLSWGARGATILTYDTWYHVALTHDGTYTRLYVNGQLDASESMTQNTVMNGAGLRIGLSPDFDGWHRYFKGLIDEVKIYNRTLSDSEVSSLAGTYPDAFSFPAKNDTALNTLTESDTITVTGISQPSSISISGGDAQYEIGGNGAWLSTPSTVSSGATVKVRLTSSSSYATTTTATLNIGGQEGTFSVTTTADTVKPVVDTFSINATESTTMAVQVSSFTASDLGGVTGYMITSSSTVPLAADAGWSASAPTSFNLTTAGSNTLYAWAKDKAGNVSDPMTDSVLLRPMLRGASTYYTSLQTACGEAISGETVKALSVTVPGSVTITGKSLTIKGGHADGYESQPGVTAIQGTLAIGTGSLTVDRVAIN